MVMLNIEGTLKLEAQMFITQFSIALCWALMDRYLFAHCLEQIYVLVQNHRGTQLEKIVNPALPCPPLTHAPKHHICMSFEHFQGW